MKRSIFLLFAFCASWRKSLASAACLLSGLLSIPVAAQSCLPRSLDPERPAVEAGARTLIRGELIALGPGGRLAPDPGRLREDLRRLLAEDDKPSAAPAKAPPPQIEEKKKLGTGGFQWEQAFRESMIFLGIQHAFRLSTEKGSRDELKGPFFRDYFATLRRLRGWDDGDPFIVNYIGHPMMGGVTGFIQVQNDPQGIREEVGLRNKRYWKSRLKAAAWSFAYSTQFELGLVSEATLGNVGIRPYDGRMHPMAYVDLVVTPVLGTGWLVGEDLLDRYLIRRVEGRIGNRAARVLFRSFLNPTRSFANLMRGRTPWHRDNRP